MAITDINISETLEAGAPSIKYTGDMDPNMQMASASDAQQQEADKLWELELKKMELDEDYLPEIIDPEEIKVASDPSWEDEWEQIYQNYKIKQIELGQEFVSKEEFMEDYQNNMASGGRVKFGLGSIFKSVGKAAKKAIKSPLGKAALLGLGAYYMPGGIKARGGFGNMFGGMGKALFGAKPFQYGVPFTNAMQTSAGTKGILGTLGLTGGSGSMMPTALGWGATAVGAGMGAAAFEGMKPDDIAQLKSNPEALRAYLKQYHSNTNPDKTDEEVDIWVEQNMFSTGGRVGLREGSTDMTISTSQNDPRNMTTLELISIIKEGRSTPEMFAELRLRGIKGVDEIALAEGQGDVGYSFDERLVDEYNPETGTAEESFLFKMRRNNPEVYGKYEEPRGYPEAGPTIMDKHYPEAGPSAEPKWMKAQGGRIGFGSGTSDKFEEKIAALVAKGLARELAEAIVLSDISPDNFKIIDALENKAEGGRIGFAYGPDQTAEAAGIMGQLPVRNNGAGVKELDLRDSGGFIPPVGVKEKADDIPAMLSNNEFVMTADAVRAAGGGSVEKGAQVMYDQMKNLENKIA